MRVKKILLCSALALMFIVSTSLSAAAAAKQLSIYSGSTGGTFYALGGAIAASLNKHVEGVSVSSSASGGSIDNLNLLHAGDADLGIVGNSMIGFAWEGQAPFKQKIQDVRAIGMVYPDVFQLVVAQAAGAKTLGDLKGKRIVVGPGGGHTPLLTEAFLKTVGLDMKKDLTAMQAGFADAAAQLKDGHVDASSTILAVPASSILELKATSAIEVMSFPNDVISKVVAQFPAYESFTIPANTYGNAAPIQTIACYAILLCRAELDEETVYKLTKAYFEYGNEIAATHAAGKYIKLELGLTGVAITPLHPGAARYYKEKGVKIPAGL
ncbi:C4-dicarboxylate ABC transporter substrate-binding protein [Deltaproteobacteria bacterium]|nr:C4-dicarboxylate ABC transporter substrate-binding protein [Deltaproteobacteria bacterium]